jgi:DNA-binding NtrC family response regulator
VKPHLLVVEDERAIQIALAGLLGRAGYEVSIAANGADAIALLETSAYDLVLTDLALGSGPSGMAVLEKTKALRPETAVVMITAHGSEKIAVEAMKAGAEDYVPKPFDNDQIRLVVKRALDRTRLARENRMLLERVEREYGFENLIGSGPAMQRVFAAIQKVAETDLTVLVRGESGTGKELVAQALHQRSPRRDRPFVAVNCAAISAELVESELFGHEKGAFTGADARRLGRFEIAHGGTIFLDEIGDMAPETQAKVLRVLQERTLVRVGGTKPIEVDVRVVAATHRNLEQEVARGSFREDLYYRLRVVELVLPPLRERAEDVPALALRFLAQVSERLGRAAPRLGDGALAALVRHGWPGNVRELRNAIEQAAVLASGPVIGEDDLRLDGAPANAAPAEPATRSAGLPFAEAKRRAVERFERAFLLDALRACGGNISRAAEQVGMVRQSLQQKIRELGLRSEDWEKRG